MLIGLPIALIGAPIHLIVSLVRFLRLKKDPDAEAEARESARRRLTTAAVLLAVTLAVFAVAAFMLNRAIYAM